MSPSNPSNTLNLAGLPVLDISNKEPLWWGQLLLCMIEGSMFFMLIAIYFYLRLRVDVWPGPGVILPGVVIPTVAFLPLIISTIGSYWASEAAKKDNRGGMILGLAVNLVFAGVFLALRFWQLRALNFNWATDAHGSIFWTILFLHTFDIVADLLMTAMLVGILVAGRHGGRTRLGVHVDSVVWYFLAAIWVPLYAVVYWAPRVIGTPR